MSSAAHLAATTDNAPLSMDTYLSGLLQQCQQRSPRVNDEIARLVSDRRQQATAQVLQAKLPSTKDEAWRFTDLSELQQLSFQLAESTHQGPVERSVLEQAMDSLALTDTQQHRLALVNGSYEPALSDLSGLSQDDIYVGPLSGLSLEKYGLLPHYLGQQTEAWDAFAWLNSADLHDVTVVWAYANAVIEQPIEVLYLATATEQATFSQPRLLVVVETGSHVTLVESYHSVGCVPSLQPHFSNTVSEIYVQVNAQLIHCRIQQQGVNDFHIGTTAIAQARDSHYTCHEISLGSHLYRHNLHLSQLGEHTETTLNGFALTTGNQIADTHTLVALAHPHATMNQLHKCIIGDHARGVFNGRVLVPQAAQLTHAAQLNRNLLLSPQARINTKPELQITADNVKCSHGATVSQLEADELFYLRSRGLNENAARHLLIDAFAAEIIDRLPLTSLQQQLTQQVAQQTVDARDETPKQNY